MLLLVAFDRRSNIWKPTLIFLKKILENYVFPILKPGLTPSQQRDRIKEYIKNVLLVRSMSFSKQGSKAPILASKEGMMEKRGTQRTCKIFAKFLLGNFAKYRILS